MAAAIDVAADAVEIAADAVADEIETVVDAAEIAVAIEIGIADLVIVVVIGTEADEAVTTTAQKLAARLLQRQTCRAEVGSRCESQPRPKCRIAFLAEIEAMTKR